MVSSHDISGMMIEGHRHGHPNFYVGSGTISTGQQTINSNKRQAMIKARCPVDPLGESCSEYPLQGMTEFVNVGKGVAVGKGVRMRNSLEMKSCCARKLLYSKLRKMDTAGSIMRVATACR